MKRFLFAPLALLLAWTVLTPTRAATVKISDLPIITAPSTNTFIEVADLNAVTKSRKYLLTNLATVASMPTLTSKVVSNNVASAGLLSVDSTKTNGIAATAAHITNAWGIFDGTTKYVGGDAQLHAIPAGGVANTVVGPGGAVTAGAFTAWTDTTGTNLTSASYTPVNKTGDSMSGPLVPPTYTVATLPASSAGPAVWCSDALTPFGTGAYVYYDGSVWRGVRTGIRAVNSIPDLLYRSYTDAQFVGQTPRILGVMASFFRGTGLSGVWSSTVQNSGSVTYAEDAYTRLATAASANATAQVQGLLHTPVAGDYLLSGYSVRFLTLPDGTDNFYAVNGWDFLSSGIATVSTKTTCFVYDRWKGSPVAAQITATNNWQCVTGNGTTWTVTDSGVAPVANTFQELTIVINCLTNAVFYINGTSVATNSSNMSPSGQNLGPTFGLVKTLGGTARQFDTRWMYYSIYYATALNFR